MESLFMEESAVNLRRSFALLSNNTTNNNRNMYGGFVFRSPQYNYPLHHPHPSVSSVSQLLLDANSAVAGGGSFRGSLPTFPPLYSSLPPVPVHHKPPLLPLPIKSATLPSTSKKISNGTVPAAITRSSSSAATASATRQNNNQKRKKKNQQQPKPSTSPKKEPAVAAAANPVKSKVKEEEETEEEFLMKPPSSSPSVYSLSPSPSSLPLPRLLLLRPRPRPRPTAKVAPVGSCNAEARGVASVSVDAGATGDLRKILRLQN